MGLQSPFLAKSMQLIALEIRCYGKANNVCYIVIGLIIIEYLGEGTGSVPHSLT